MTLYPLLVWIFSVIAVIYIQLRYARANYPSTWQWKLTLFLSGFSCGAMGSVAFLHQTAAWRALLLMTAFSGIFAGLGFTFLTPYNMQNFIPKRDDHSNT